MRTRTRTAVLVGLKRTAVRSSVRTSPGLDVSPDWSETGPTRSRTGLVALGDTVIVISLSFRI